MKSVVIIPARMDSKRFPGKPLADCGGVPLLQRTYDAAKQTQAVEVIVASPDKEICNYCRDADIMWKPTRDDHPSGTHRCAEVAERMSKDIDIIVNWQVDEPLVDPRDVDRLIDLQPQTDCIVTLVARIDDEQTACDEDVVKTILLEYHHLPCCQWFSRAPMSGAWGHVGIYAFNRQTLLDVGQMLPNKLSQLESLEQLTWIEQGKIILAVSAANLPQAVNTPADLDKVIRHYETKISPQGAD